MTLRLNRFTTTIALTALAFAAALAVFVLVNGRSGRQAGGATGADAGPSPAALAGASTDTRIRSFQSLVRAHPRDPRGYAFVADAYLQKVRETGDASFYQRAGGAYATALRLDPADPAATTGMGTLALARHDFRSGLRFGLRAHALAPEVVKPYGVMVDALVELGRYGRAGRVLQRMVDLEPNLAAYARVSYFRELHGDLPGAIAAMRLAVSAGGQAAENVAYVQTLLGTLLFDTGRLSAAREAYRTALARFSGYVPATAGVARVDAARGRLASATRLYRSAVTRLPLPEYVVGLGETELAAGRVAQARRDLALVRAEESLLRANGVNTDVDLALFEAGHGSPLRGVALAHRAYRAAPSVRSADAVGWALTRAGRPDAGLRLAQRALRLGSRDPMFLFHAGIAARGAGNRALARAYLSRALSLNPRFNPLYAPRAQRALETLR